MWKMNLQVTSKEGKLWNFRDIHSPCFFSLSKVRYCPQWTDYWLCQFQTRLWHIGIYCSWTESQLLSVFGKVDNEMKIVLQPREEMTSCNFTPFHNPSLKYDDFVNDNPMAPHSQSHVCISSALAGEALSHPSRWGME